MSRIHLDMFGFKWPDLPGPETTPTPPVPPVPPIPEGDRYYIDPLGNNGNDGSLAFPWLTLNYACTQVLTPGDIIHVNAGTYDEVVTCDLSPGINIEGEGDTSIITSSTLVNEWDIIIDMISGSLVNGNQSISDIKFDGDSITAAQAIQIEKRNNVIIHDCTFIDFHYCAIYWIGDGGFSGADPYDGAYPPDNYVTGSEFYNNTVTNCAYNIPWGWGRGSLYIGGHEGMLLYNNTITNNARAAGSNGYPIKAFANGGWMKGFKCYDNHLEVGAIVGGSYPFAIEGAFFIGGEFYNNTMIGALDINFMEKGEYDYGLYIHHNTLGPLVTQTSASWTGIYLEFGIEDVIIEYNWFRNLPNGIHHTMRYPRAWVKRVKVQYNIFSNTGASVGSAYSNLRFGETEYNFLIEDYEIYNNVFYANPAFPHFFCINMRGFEDATGIKIINNIVKGISWYWFESNRGDFFDGLWIQNNIIYDCANGNGLLLGGTPANYTNSGNQLGVDPLFVSPITDYHLQVGSPAINNGLNVGLTKDYDNVDVSDPPEIGAYEY